MTPSCITKALAFTAVTLLPLSVSAQNTVVISEIMFNPDGDENAREYVEVLNLSDSPLSLTGYEIGDGEGFDLITPVDGDPGVIQSGGYGLILDPDYFEGDDFYDIPTGTALFIVADQAIGSRGLSNSTAETVSLVTTEGDTISQVTCDIACPAGHSWERILPDGGDSASNFAPSHEVDGTPGSVNSVYPAAFDAALDSLSVTIEPTVPVYGKPLAVTLTCRNAGRELLSDVRVSLYLSAGPRPVSGNPAGMATFTETIQPGGRSAGGTMTVDPLPGGRVTLIGIITSDSPENAANDTLRVIIDVPVPAGTLILNEVMAAPVAGDAEWVEVLNTGMTAVSLAGWGVCDSGESWPGATAETAFVPAETFAVITGNGMPPAVPSETILISAPSFPALNNDGDTVRLMDWVGIVTDSMTYTDTTGGVSLELISPERSGMDSGWDLCTADSGSTPGRRNSIAYPPLGVEDGEPARLTLTVDPNPFGGRTSITYTLPFPLARVRLLIYDRRGRLAATIRDTHESGAEWSGEWDGRDNDGDPLTAGPYILQLEAFDKSDGTVRTARTMIVIGARL